LKEQYSVWREKWKNPNTDAGRAAGEIGGRKAPRALEFEEGTFQHFKGFSRLLPSLLHRPKCASFDVT
jgi:hypothetical protein